VDFRQIKMRLPGSLPGVFAVVCPRMPRVLRPLSAKAYILLLSNMRIEDSI
jgi:hypothetical protein